jgi:hypothetical protein
VISIDKPEVIDGRILLIASFSVVTLIVAFLIEPIPQAQAYHDFADNRAMLGIPNALNVLSNLPFLLVGLLGLSALSQSNRGAHHPAWWVFFIGVSLVAFGSAFYHLAPDNSSLVWDRLPMTVAFMGLFIALLSEYADLKLGPAPLIAAILIGVGTVIYWAFTDDLRFYAWVQFMPLGAVLILLFTHGSRYTYSWLLGISLTFYVIAKLAEHFDSAIFNFLSESVSGHTLKHLAAALGCYILLLFLKRRRIQQ